MVRGMCLKLEIMHTAKERVLRRAARSRENVCSLVDLGTDVAIRLRNRRRSTSNGIREVRKRNR